MVKGKTTVLIAADTFPPDVNGAAKFTVRLAVGLVSRGHRVVVVAPSPDTEFGLRLETHEGAELEVYRLRSWKWFSHPWLRFALPWEVQRDSAAILDEIRPDVVHVQSHINVGWGMVRVAHERGLRIVATNHFMPENATQFVPLPQFVLDWIVRVLWRIASKTYRMADAITTPTRKAADYLEKAVKVDGVHAISCGLNVSNYRPVLGKRSDPYALFLGRVEQEKHIEELLYAMKRFQKSELRAIIAGAGDDRGRLERITRDEGLTDRVEFRGLVGDDELVTLFSEAALFVMPSTAELQSIATMEAMASALPVVAANAMALPHLVHDGENGFLYEPRDISGLVASMRRVLDSTEDGYRAFQQESLAIVANHDISTTLDRFEDIYRGTA
ncbi:MAG: glycosyltransferase [Microbacteriaceae bacterium]